MLYLKNVKKQGKQKGRDGLDEEREEDEANVNVCTRRRANWGWRKRRKKCGAQEKYSKAIEPLCQ